MRQLAQDIYTAVWRGRLKEPFSSTDVRRVCPSYADGTPGTFLPKHRIGNPGRNTELFKRASAGRYQTTSNGWREWSRVTGQPIPPGR